MKSRVNSTSMWLDSSFIVDLVGSRQPKDMAQALCKKYRELTGAEVVSFFLHTDESIHCRPLSVSPESRMELFEKDRLAGLCFAAHPDPVPFMVDLIPAADPLYKALDESGIKNLLRVPIKNGDVLIGSIFLMDIPDPDRLEEIQSGFSLMAPTIGLAIQNCLIQQELEQHRTKLEKQVVARTVEIEAINGELQNARLAALNMMEDAIIAQTSMAFQNNLFQTFMDTLPSLVFFKDLEGRLISANKAFGALCKTDPKNMIGKTVFDFFSESEAEQLTADDQLVMQTGKPLQVEQYIAGCWWLSIKAPRYDEAGALIGSYGITWDISGRKAAENELLRNSDNMEIVIDVLRYQAESVQQFLDYSLKKAMAMTGSEVGYIYYYDEEDQQLTLNSWANTKDEEYVVSHPETCCMLAGAGEWGDVVRLRRSVTYSSLKAGAKTHGGDLDDHFNLDSYLNVPLFNNNKIVAVVGVANKSVDYSESDALELQLLVDSVWKTAENIRFTERIQQSETMFRSYIENAPYGIFLFDENGAYLDVNSATSDITGYTRDELLNMNIEDWHRDDDGRNMARDLFSTIVKQGQVHVEVPFLTKAGEHRYCKISSVKISNERYLSFTEDITTRMETDAALKKSREQFATLLSNLPGMAYRCNLDEKWTMHFISDGCVALTGYSPEDLVDNKVQSYNGLIHPDDQNYVTKTVAASLERERHFEIEYRIISRSGEEKWVWERGIGRTDQTGCVIIEGFISDNTERRVAEQEIFDLARFPQENTNPVVRVSNDGALLYKNPAAKHLEPVLSVELGESVSELWLKMIHKARKIGRPVETEIQIKDAVFVVTLAPVADRGYTNLYAHDITQRKHAQESMRKSKEHLRTTLDSIGDAVISTDKKGLVTNMNPVAERLTGWCIKDAIGKKMVEVFRAVREDSRRSVINLVEQVISTGETVELANHTILLNRDGGELPIADSAAPIRSSSGEIVGVVIVFRDQTEERASRRALEESEARFRDLLERMELIPIQGYDENRKVIYWNAASTRVYGYTRTEALGQKIEDLIIPAAARKKVMQDTKNWFAGGPVIPTEECMLRDKNGHPVPVHSSHIMHVTISGKKEMFCIDVDLRDLKSAENRMRESRNLLRSIIDTIPGRVWWKDLDCVFMGSNIQHSLDAGFEDPHSLVGQCDYDIHSKELADRYIADDIDVMQSGNSKLGMHEPVILHDGTTRWMEINKVPLRNEKGEIIGTVGTAQDITARLENETERLRLSTAIEQSPESIIVTDAEGTIQYVNPAFEKNTGFMKNESIGQNPRMLQSKEHDQSFYIALWDTISSGKIWEGRFINRRKDGALFTEDASIAPVKDADGQITNYVAVKRDITTELIREEEFRQSQKLEAIGLLAGGIAHDFNNILQAIMGFSELLMLDLVDGTEEYQNVVEIKGAAKKAVGLTKQLLVFGRKQTVDTQFIDVNEMIHEAQALVGVLLGEQYEILLQLSEHLPSIVGDAGQLTQVMMNLSVNSRDAMPTGGTLTFSTEEITLMEQDVVLMPEGRTGSFVCLSVRDTGCGIDKEALPHLFEPFYTTKELGKGTGLGLSVVYGIMKQCNGWIRVLSNKGEGTEFKLYFPNTQVSRSVSYGEPGTIEEGEVAILVVDDDPKVRRLILHILKPTNFKAIAKGSVAEAVDEFEKDSERYALLLTDMQLPDGSGIELADRLRSVRPQLAILLCSGDANEIKNWKNSENCSYNFISKPFSVIGLVRSIQEAIVNAASDR